MSWQQDLYPIAIFQTRYWGVYEGGAWVAFCCSEEEDATSAFGNDIECSYWWANNRHMVGVGDTPNEALDNLKTKRCVPQKF